jgi:hypothetical protein
MKPKTWISASNSICSSFSRTLLIQKIKATEYLADYRALSPLLLGLSLNKQQRYGARAKRKPIHVMKNHARRISLWGMISSACKKK